jgi:hypothetical protein
MDKTTEQPIKRGYRKHAVKEPTAEVAPKKGFKKWQAKFSSDKWDGTFADETDNALSIREDILKNYERDGLSFKWVRESVFNWPDEKNIARHLKNGWQPVEEDDFPDITCVKEGGLILMARPLPITKKAKAIQAQEAVAPVTTLRKRAEGGDISEKITLDAKHSSARAYNKHRSTWEKISVPVDD